jgi:C-terminal processing protease CtpA/Prc
MRELFVTAALLATAAVGLAATPEKRADSRPVFVEPGRGKFLGVKAVSTTYGVLIVEVIPGTAAWRAGLESGDRILSVDGMTVGTIDGIDYSLASELRRAGEEVRLRVWDCRSKRVIEVKVKLG